MLGAVFPVGLIITVMTGAELFTGDAMLAPMAAFIHKISWASVLNLWLWVYIGNFIGSVIFGVYHGIRPVCQFRYRRNRNAHRVWFESNRYSDSKDKLYKRYGAVSAFLKGIACNWLVNLAILLGICADDAIGKIVGIWFPIFAFVASGFEHSVANMYFIPTGHLLHGP